MIKAVFLDIDGTLRNTNKEITLKTKDVLKKYKEKGILTVICSGRSREYAHDIALQANASDIVIASDGADVYDYSKSENIFLNSISNETCLAIYNLIINTDIKIFIDTTDGQYTNDSSRHSASVNYTEDLKSIIENNKILHMHFASKDYNKLDSLISKLEQFEEIKIGNNGAVYIFENISYLFIAKKSSNKGLAIRELCQYLNISKSETISFGDELNDIEMFLNTGIAVAMENANNELKKYATDFTLSNDDNGVAIYLEKLL